MTLLVALTVVVMPPWLPTVILIAALLVLLAGIALVVLAWLARRGFAEDEADIKSDSDWLFPGGIE